MAIQSGCRRTRWGSRSFEFAEPIREGVRVTYGRRAKSIRWMQLGTPLSAPVRRPRGTAARPLHGSCWVAAEGVVGRRRRTAESESGAGNVR